MARDLYLQLGDELRAALKEIHDKNALQRRLKTILELAAQIGGAIKTHAEALHTTKDLNAIRQQMIKLEQETREL
jgi:hypothetical protein